MKLYFAPGACSLSPHIVLHEAGIAADYEEVDLPSKRVKSGGDFRKINPKGTVPTLQFDDGDILTEGPAIVQYIADQAPTLDLAPPNGSRERYRLQEWLNFIGSEVHKPFSLLFSATATEESRTAQRKALHPKLDFLAEALDRKPFLMGAQFTVADASLYNILIWSVPTKTNLGPWPALQEYRTRISTRPAVQTALREEGLIE